MMNAANFGRYQELTLKASQKTVEDCSLTTITRDHRGRLWRCVGGIPVGRIVGQEILDRTCQQIHIESQYLRHYGLYYFQRHSTQFPATRRIRLKDWKENKSPATP